MSDIDAVRHYRVGMFCSTIPVFQPLDIVWLGHSPEDGPLSGEAIPGELVIGGDSGEHPALIVHDVELAVARYIARWSPHPFEVIEKLSCEKRSVRNGLPALEYCTWSPAEHARFREAIQLPAEATVDDWVMENVGEFVYHLMPELSPRIAGWQKRYPGLPVAGIISIPYGKYCGNGVDRFRIVDTLAEESQNDTKF